MARWIFMSFGLVFGACSLVPDYRRPAFELPMDWTFRDPIPKGTTSFSPRWWADFGDNGLNRLIAAALTANIDLSAAAARVEQARAQAKIAGAPLLPDASLNGTGIRSWTDRSDANARPSFLGFNVNYEADLWGRLRAARDAALTRQQSVDLLREALRLVVTADVAQAYFRVVSLRDQQQIAVSNIRNAKEILRIVDIRVQLGAVSALDLAQQKTELAGHIAQLELLRQQTGVARNALAILLGLAPRQLKLRTATIDEIIIPSLNAPHPKALLDLRPDVRQAELELRAVHADIGVARAAFYPRLRLGLESLFSANAAAQPAGLVLALAGDLTTPIFQGGRLSGELERTESRRDELL